MTMIIDVTPGTTVMVDAYRYTVEEHSAFHDIDFRLDLVRLSGATPAHERWLAAVLPEPYLMLMQRLEQDWLSPPLTSVVHEGEIFVNLYRGTANRARRARSGARSKDARVDYAVFRANSGRVMVTIGRNDEIEAWLGVTLPQEAVTLPSSSARS